MPVQKMRLHVQIALCAERQLQLLLPGVRVFLDVDNLDSPDKLEGYVAASHAMLVLLGSPKYLLSKNCAREVKAGMDTSNDVKLIRVNESDSSKNGSSLKTLSQMYLRIATTPTDGDNSDGGVIDPWPLAFTPKEAKQLMPKLLEPQGVILWHRLKDFQLVALSAIAKEMLLATPVYRHEHPLPLFVEGALAWARPVFPCPVALYSSKFNEGAADVAQKLSKDLGDKVTPVDKMDCVDKMDKMDSRQDRVATFWLLFLSPTCFLGENGKNLADEVEKNLKRGIQPMLLWMPASCEDFRLIMEATPKPLEDLGLYKSLAIEWWDGMYRITSVRLAARALGAQLQGGSGCVEKGGEVLGAWMDSILKKMHSASKHEKQKINDRSTASDDGSELLALQ